MQDTSATSFLRCCMLWLTVTSGCVALLLAVSGDLPHHVPREQLGALRFADLLVAGSAVALAACACWFWLVTSLATLEAATGLPAWRAGCPELLWRGVLAACGAALCTAPLAPAAAHGPGMPPVPTDSGHRELVGLPLPDRPLPDRLGTVRTGPGPATTPTPTHRVRTGDTLWDLARQRLPADATDADITAAWQEIWRANRDLVGDDPDLIHPGSVLRLPETEEQR